MKEGEPRQISVFIASPGDLAPERKVFKDTIDSLNTGFADGAGVKFVPLGWEDILAETGRRAQDVINRDIEECHLFILALYRRWGQPAPDSRFSSYTEEEFHLALGRWKKQKSPEVFVFFKSLDTGSMADPGPELAKVLAFRKNLEQGKHILIRTFNAADDFGKEIDRHLRAFARGEWGKLDTTSQAVDFPEADLSALREGAKADLSLVRAQQTDLAMARAAVDAAHDDRIQEASLLFAKATEETTDLSILSLAAGFFRQIGDQENASKLVQRQAAIARDRTIAARYYMALVPKGILAGIQEQALAQILSQTDPEIADEIRSVYQEAFGGGRYESFMLDTLVKHYSTAELVQLARFLASPEGQSSIQKTQLILADTMEFADREWKRVLKERYPEAAAKTEQPPGETGQTLNALPGPETPPGPRRLLESQSDDEK